MNKKPSRIAAVAAALLLSLVLQGCGTAPAMSGGGPIPPGITARPCTPGICILEVTVVDCTRPGGITVDPPLLDVTVARNMRWVIVTRGYEFAPNGIEFSPPNSQFVIQHSPDTNEFRVRNLKTQNGDFYYYVNVDGCLRADPWIRNR